VLLGPPPPPPPTPAGEAPLISDPYRPRKLKTALCI